MTKKLYLALCLFAVIFSSCDVIPNEDRIIDVPAQHSLRSVLLVDFTGWQCVNCPEAAQIVSTLIDEYPENIVVVSMHPMNSAFTDPLGIGPDFRAQEALDYLEYFGGSSTTPLPSGMINNKSFNGKTLLDKNVWMANFMAERNIAPKCLLEMEGSGDAENTTVSVTINPTEELKENLSLQMWLIESNVVSYQKTKKEILDNYVHKHIFRGTLNGLWGDELNIITEPITRSYTFKVDDKYAFENCGVVAVVINTNTKEVIQAAEFELSEILSQGSEPEESGEGESDVEE